jgi:hypothetical protein
MNYMNEIGITARLRIHAMASYAADTPDFPGVCERELRLLTLFGCVRFQIIVLKGEMLPS